MAAAGLCLAILVAVLVAVDRPIQLPKGYVPYDQAVSVLCSGQVKTLGQTHQRLVVLDLKNGTTIRTIEPQIDMVFHECANCRDACQGITYWTE